MRVRKVLKYFDTRQFYIFFFKLKINKKYYIVIVWNDIIVTNFVLKSHALYMCVYCK